MNTGRVILVGSREWMSKATIIRGLSDVSAMIPTSHRVTLVHLPHMAGATGIAVELWRVWVKTWPGEFDDAIVCPDIDAALQLGADYLLTFTDERDDDIAEYARLARDTGIRVLDYGVSTADKVAAA